MATLLSVHFQAPTAPKERRVFQHPQALARFQTETGWKRELAIRHRLSQQSDRTEKPAQPPHLDILPEERYCHLECLLKSKASESNCFRAPSIC